MDGFRKFDFAREQKNRKILGSLNMARRKKLSKRRSGILVFILLILVLFLYLSYSVYKSALATYQQTRVLGLAVKKQNLIMASDELAKTKKSLSETQRKLGLLFPLRFVPLLGSYYSDVDHLLKAEADGLTAAGVVIQSLRPYADILGLKGEGNFATGTAEERIKTAVLTMGKIIPRIDEISTSLNEIKKEVDQINPSRYPSLIFGAKVHSNLVKLQEATDQSVLFVNQARPLLKVLPSLLGESQEKKYLILFQNDKELRATGGFITAYAIFRVDKGVIHVDRSEDIYRLDATIANKPSAPRPILKYLPKVYSFNLRDSNLSPDFISSMNTFRSLYDRAGGKVNVDGIIALDTHVLVSTIKILDDHVTAGGITFTTKTDKRCDCPQVIYELENNISRPVGFIKTERKSLLGELLYAILQKALSSSPKTYWGPLFQSMLTATSQKHILFDLFDKEAQKGVEALNAAGRIRSFEGDYLHINDTNFSGAKVNLFMQESVDNSYTLSQDGSILKKITITYKNPYPPSDCNLERGGLCLNAVYRDWLRIYVPKGSELLKSTGSEVKLTTYEDLGKTVFEGFLTVRPEGAATFTVTYRLPFKLSNNSPLPLLIQKQPGTDGNNYTITVNNKQVETFPLLTDKELKIRF